MNFRKQQNPGTFTVGDELTYMGPRNVMMVRTVVAINPADEEGKPVKVVLSQPVPSGQVGTGTNRANRRHQQSKAYQKELSEKKARHEKLEAHRKAAEEARKAESTVNGEASTASDHASP